MQTRTLIMFEREERNVFQRANLHVHIAFPDLSDGPKHGTRVMLRLSMRDPQLGTLANLRAARDAYTELLARTQEEQAYWSSEHNRIQALIDSGVTPPEDDNSGQLIADPLQAAKLLAEIRVSQVRDLEAALTLINEALLLLPPEDPADSDEKYTGV